MNKQKIKMNKQKIKMNKQKTKRKKIKPKKRLMKMPKIKLIIFVAMLLWEGMKIDMSDL